MRADGKPYFPLKIVIAGGFGVGKTTMVQALSEIPPLVTEEALTTASVGLDDVSAVPGKSTTTVAMDFGRISMEDLVLYMFGTPGQDRFWFMWDELARGSVGAVVLVDLRRVDDCFPAIDFFESRALPFVLAVNRFPGADAFSDDEVRDALALKVDTPIVRIDARSATSCTTALIRLVEHALTRSVSNAGPGRSTPLASTSRL